MKGREEKREEERAGNERLALLRARGIMALVALLFLFQAGLFIYNKFFDGVSVAAAAESPAAARRVAARGNGVSAGKDSSAGNGASVATSQSAAKDQFAAKGQSAAKGKYSARRVPRLVNLNRADSAELVALYGVGAYTAMRILNYRERLGSFAYVEQLLEVKGMDSARFAAIEQDVVVREEEIKRFSLDTVSEAFMRRNPYIGAYAAQGIVIMRSLGVHITPMMLYKEKILSLERARKLMFYCK
ncbi:MAG: helix-hairpin-helix domain-containing protein [Candidatus Egerieousia sp.]|nr:helix-hairpin-helix domain-containing protein [Candidatus Egerieousia sp.]